MFTGTAGSPPTFQLTMAALDGADWRAIAPDSPLRRWQMIEIGPADSLVGSPLRISERLAEETGMLDTDPVSAIDNLLAAARAGMDRVQCEDLAREINAGALIVDIRPVEQRIRDGELDGALVIDRNVLEWRLDPTCPHHIPEVTSTTQRIVVVCNEGYSSSLAAATLRQIGIVRATDLIGGFQSLKAHANLHLCFSPGDPFPLQTLR